MKVVIPFIDLFLKPLGRVYNRVLAGRELGRGRPIGSLRHCQIAPIGVMCGCGRDALPAEPPECHCNVAPRSDCPRNDLVPVGATRILTSGNDGAMVEELSTDPNHRVPATDDKRSAKDEQDPEPQIRQPTWRSTGATVGRRGSCWNVKAMTAQYSPHKWWYSRCGLLSELLRICLS
jgi:hypothetical protein